MHHDKSAGMLRHLVLFRFKNPEGNDAIARIEAAFRALPGKIPAIAGFEWGTDVSDASRAQGFTHCFLLSFGDEHERDVYVEHPAHKDFVNMLLPELDSILVVDYWAQG